MTRSLWPARRSALARTGAAAVFVAAAMAAGPATVSGVAAGAPAAGVTLRQPGTELKVTYRAAPGAPAEVWTLICGPPAGTHPDAAAACAKLASVDADVFQPTAPDAFCTQIFGGSQAARITGVLRSEPVDASFTRLNGCEISRWDSLVPVLPSDGIPAAAH